MDHHPDLDIRYNKIAVTLSTHSAGGITGNDVALARDGDGGVDGQTLHETLSD